VVRGAGGELILLGNPDEYTASQWLLRDGDARDAAAARAGARCDEWGCVAEDLNGRMVALALRAGSLADDCIRADVVVSTVPLRRPCPNAMYVIDRFAVLREGAMALRFDGESVRAVSVAGQRGLRPWSGLNNGE